jgi:hypothetical protein
MGFEASDFATDVTPVDPTRKDNDLRDGSDDENRQE